MGRKVLQHVVIFKLVESFTDEQLEKAVKQTAVMVDTIPGIITASFAKNADNLYDTFRLHTKGYTHTLLVTFENEQALKRYDTAPTHLELGKLIIPFMEDAIATDTIIDTFPDDCGGQKVAS